MIRLQLQVAELRSEGKQLRLAVYLLFLGVALLGPAVRLVDSRDRSSSLSLRQSWLAYVVDGADSISRIDDESRSATLGLGMTQVGLSLALLGALVGVVAGLTILTRPTGRTTAIVVVVVSVAMIVGAVLTGLGLLITPPYGSDHPAHPGLALLGTIGAGVWLSIGSWERD